MTSAGEVTCPECHQAVDASDTSKLLSCTSCSPNLYYHRDCMSVEQCGACSSALVEVVLDAWGLEGAHHHVDPPVHAAAWADEDAPDLPGWEQQMAAEADLQ